LALAILDIRTRTGKILTSNYINKDARSVFTILGI